MVGILTIFSVLGLYVEVVLQLCDLFSTQNDSFQFPIFVVVTSLLVVTFITMNLASLIVALKSSRFEERTSEKTVCVALHSAQLGLVWRAYRLLFRYNQSEWLHFTRLRLVYPSLLTFPYIVLQGRRMFVPEHPIRPLPVLSLVASLASFTVALCSYTLRHRLHEDLLVEGLPGKAHSRLRHAGVAMLLLGTCLCLATRLGSFMLISAQHGFWVLLPFCVHFFVHVAVRLGCSTLSGHKAACSSDSGDCPQLLRVVATSYLNTLELVEEDLRRVQCRYVFVYSLVLVENLAMTASWLLLSPLDYAVKLVVVVGLLAAFLVALVLKFVSCGCIAGQGAERGTDSPGVRSSVDSPRSLTSLADCESARPGNRGSGKWSIAAKHYSRTVGPFRADKEFHASAPMDKSNASASLATISSQTIDVLYHGDRRLSRKRGRQHANLSHSHTSSTALSDSTVSKALRELQHASHSDEHVHKKQRGRDKQTQQLSSTEDGLVTEADQRHLQDLAKHSELSEAVWLASLRGVFPDHPDACSFDDPILASRLVMESLGHHRRPSSRRTSSSKSKHRHSEHSSNDGRVSRRGKPYTATGVEPVGSYGEPISETLRESTVSGNKAASGPCERYSDDVQYRYWTRCSCRGSPSSTPRRRPVKQQSSSRKTQSHAASAHCSHLRTHHHVPRMHQKNATRQADTRHSGCLKEIATVSMTDPNNSTLHADSACCTGKPPLPSSRFDDDVCNNNKNSNSNNSSNNSVVVSQKASYHHWSLCPHHANDGSERAATWPRKGRRSTRANSGVGTRLRPALPDDAVHAQDVVRLWLRGLESSGLHRDLHITAHAEHQPIAPVCGAHYGQTRSEDVDDSTDCSMCVKLDDDDDDDDDDDGDSVVFVSTNQNSLYPNLRQPNPSKLPLSNGFQQRAERKTVQRSHSGRHSDDTRHAGDGPDPACERKDSRAFVTTHSTQATAPPLAYRPQTGPLREHASQAARQQSLHRNEPNVIIADLLGSHDVRWKAIAHDLRRREVLPRSDAEGHVSKCQVLDSGISISTAPDSDGSRSTTQGHCSISTVPDTDGSRSNAQDHLSISAARDSDASRSNSRGYVSSSTVLDRDGSRANIQGDISWSKPFSSGLLTETLTHRNWAQSNLQGKRPPNLQHSHGHQQSSVQHLGSSVHDDNEPVPVSGVTLDVHESLV